MAKEIDDAVRALEAEAKNPPGKANASLCVIWKSGGKEIVQAMADAVKTSNPLLYKFLIGVIAAINLLCP